MKFRLNIAVYTKSGKYCGYFCNDVTLPGIPPIGSNISFIPQGTQPLRPPSKSFVGLLSVKSLTFSLIADYVNIDLEEIILYDETEVEPVAEWMERNFNLFFD